MQNSVLGQQNIPEDGNSNNPQRGDATVLTDSGRTVCLHINNIGKLGGGEAAFAGAYQ